MGVIKRKCRKQSHRQASTHPNTTQRPQSCDTNTTATAEEQPTSEEFSKIFHKIELKFRPDEIIYTDGSRKAIPHLGLVTGSGVYREHKHAHLSLKVHPYEQGVLNNINRAELVALLIALRHCRPRLKESIATDSKCSMQKIGRHLRSPSSTVDDCHRPLLEAIGTRSCNEHKQGMRQSCSKLNRI